MKKEFFKRETKRLANMNRDRLSIFLQDGKGISPRIAKWAFENLRNGSGDIDMYCLDKIAFNRSADSWSRKYFWKLYRQYKNDSFGDWVIIALCRASRRDNKETKRYIRIYLDPTVHPDVHGSAVYAINNFYDHEKADQEFRQRVREICALALKDPSPYARSGGIWLAEKLEGFEEEIDDLRSDHTSLFGGPTLTVSSHISS